MTVKRAYRLAIASMALGLAMIVAAPLIARAGANDVHMGWQVSQGVCVNYPASGGWYKYVAAAVNAWDKSEATVVRRDSCAASGFSGREIVRFKSVYRTDRVCATTTAADGTGDGQGDYDWKPMSRVGTGTKYVWTPRYYMLISINMDPSARSGCLGSGFAVQHVIAHELGHALDEGHAAGGIMGSQGYGGDGWRYSLPTADNIRIANESY